MDLDAFTAVREPHWDRLEKLAKRRSLSGAEADELARLYQSSAADLSQVRSAAPDPVLISRLSTTLAAARSSLAGARQPIWRDVATFVAHGYPAALYRMRWLIVAVMVGFLLVATSSAIEASADMDAVGPVESRELYADEAFARYYSENPSTSFFSGVWANNSQVMLGSIAGGFTGILPIYVQYENAALMGTVFAIMDEADQLALFFQLILPHGLLELTAIWVAGAAGLRMFWSLCVPGSRPRLRAIAEEGRALIGVGLGTIGVLAVAGFIEGFVTGSSVLPWIVKDIIGVLALAAFWVYVLGPGRAAARAGVTGDVARDERGAYAEAA